MARLPALCALALCALANCGCGARLERSSVPGESEEGLAVYYADSLHGKKTASGERYDKGAMTAAHRQLPFGTVVRVTSLVNRRNVEVRINDRGPGSSRRRIIDLSRAAAERLDMLLAGVVEVRVEVVASPEEDSEEATRR
jgi:rare lipoprotein A